MTLYDEAKAACDQGRTLTDAMLACGAKVADRSWPVVRAVEQARFEFPLTRAWPVTVWLRNGPGDDDPLEAIADIGGVVFDLQETPDTRHMTDDQIMRYTRAEVRKQIREGIKAARMKRHPTVLETGGTPRPL